MLEETALSAASAEANKLRSAAQDRAERLIEDAVAETAALVRRWRAAAEQLADLEERRRLAAARAEARAKVLRAQSSVRTQAIAAAHAAARQLVGDPRFELLLDRLSSEARGRLSAAGRVDLAPAPDGGFVARAGSHEIDYRLDTQVDRQIQSMAHELERLWQ
jgi:vacuolar-type H+-ATPase subunit E/Vma4